MIFGVDVSAYQPGFDFGAARRDGMDFAIVKATEGTGWRSPNYRDQIARARAAGLLVAAYHYVRGSDVAGQLANIRSMVAVDTPLVLDVEDGAGDIRSIRDLNRAVNAAGYRTPFIYIPRWYWQGHMGSPDLRGLPPNWLSWYPDNTVRDARAGAAMLPPSVWQPFGGLEVGMVQFTSSMRVANYPSGKIDGNVFRGTRDQLAALLGGQEEDEVGHVDTISDAAAQKIADALRYSASQGPEGDGPNYNDNWFWTNRFVNLLPGMAEKLDALGAAVAAQADADERVSLTPEQLETLRAEVRSLGDQLDEGFANLAARLVGKDEEAIAAALREFFGRAVGREADTSSEVEG